MQCSAAGARVCERIVAPAYETSQPQPPIKAMVLEDRLDATDDPDALVADWDDKLRSLGLPGNDELVEGSPFDEDEAAVLEYCGRAERVPNLQIASYWCAAWRGRGPDHAVKVLATFEAEAGRFPRSRPRIGAVAAASPRPRIGAVAAASLRPGRRRSRPKPVGSRPPGVESAATEVPKEQRGRRRDRGVAATPRRRRPPRVSSLGRRLRRDVARPPRERRVDARPAGRADVSSLCSMLQEDGRASPKKTAETVLVIRRESPAVTQASARPT